MTVPRYADVVVVGGGSCGSVVAARLSEDPACSVVLLEAGRGYRNQDDVPAEVRSAHVLPIGPDSSWIDSYSSELTPSIRRYVARGRILGGSGAVNGGYFLRALPSDFDAWPASWSFCNVLPYFRHLENDADFGASDELVHGACGPMPVSRVASAEQSPITSTFVDAALGAGFEFEPDKNDPHVSGGVGPVPRNVFDGRRMNTAMAYLLPALGRDNLSVLDEATVQSVTFDGPRATGVAVKRNGTLAHLRAGRVVLCAGALRTPQLLMLSGIGPADDLAALGISTIMDQPRVGRGSSDHPEIAVYHSNRVPHAPSSPLEAVLHVGDLEIRPYTTSFDQIIPGLPAGNPMIGVALMRPDSRGDITLTSADPAATPRVRYRYLESSDDRSALTDGVDLVRAMMGDSVAGADGLFGGLGTSIHLSGGCAMGDDDSVLDDVCRVRGIEGVDIVDTSAFPVVPSRGPHATAVMLAERASHFIANWLASGAGNVRL